MTRAGSVRNPAHATVLLQSGDILKGMVMNVDRPEE